MADGDAEIWTRGESNPSPEESVVRALHAYLGFKSPSRTVCPRHANQFGSARQAGRLAPSDA